MALSRFNVLLASAHVVGTLFFAAPSVAQDAGSATTLLRLPSSTRAMAMGGAFAFNRWRDVGAVFLHPGAMIGSLGVEAGIHRLEGDAVAATFAGGKAWWSGHLVVGLQVITAAENAVSASVGYARTVKGVRAGVVAKIIDASRAGETATSPAFDVGVARRLGPVNLALSGRNIGSSLDFETSSESLPTDVTLGASTNQEQLGPLDFVVACAISYREDGDWVPAVGVEISYWPISGRTFAVRGGITREPVAGTAVPTLGAAYTGDSLTVEYAFQSEDGPGAGHRFGLIWR